MGTNGHGNSDVFGGLELAVEHQAGKLRRSSQRVNTFSGAHEWRRDEGEARKSLDSRKRTSFAYISSEPTSYRLSSLLTEPTGEIVDPVFSEDIGTSIGYVNHLPLSTTLDSIPAAQTALSEYEGLRVAKIARLAIKVSPKLREPALDDFLVLPSMLGT